MVAALYLRASDPKQVKGTSLEDQERQGIAWAQSKGFEYQTYVEGGVTGKKLEPRKAWQRLEEDVEAGKIHSVWTCFNDRFSRNADDAANMLKFLHSHNVAFYDTGKLIDPTDCNDKFTFRIHSAVSEYNGSLIVERAIRGIALRRDEGKWASSKLFGYCSVHDPDGNRRREIVPEEAEIVQRMFALYLKGMTARRIAFTLWQQGYRWKNGRRFDATWILRASKNPRYAGLAYNSRGEIIEGRVYPAIIDRKTWDRACNQIVAYPEQTRRNYADHLSSAVVRCSRCGAAYNFKPVKSGSPYKAKLSKKKDLSTPCYCHHDHGQKCEQRPKVLQGWWLDRIVAILYLMAVSDTKLVGKLYDKQSATIEREREQIVKDLQRIDERIASLERGKKRVVSLLMNDEKIKEADVSAQIMEANAELQELQRAHAQGERDLELKQERTALIVREFGAQRYDEFVAKKTTDRERRDAVRRIVESATIQDRIITVKFISGRTFEVPYEPRDEATTTKALAKQAKVNKTLLKEDTLETLLAELRQRGFVDTVRVAVDSWKEEVKNG
jgi:site-specific DNA recombinase